MEETPENQTAEWYQQYDLRKGKDRNDILTNPGVLFQILAFQQSLIEALRTLPINRNWKILDVGCGSGGSLLHFLDFGFPPSYLFGIDILQERVSLGKGRFPNLNLICGDASQMSYNSNHFDVVMESTMFIQVTNASISKKIAQEMLRVVKPSGYLLLIDWRYSFGKTEYKAMSRRRIDNLFGVGSTARFHSCTHGALIPPLGRFLSSYFQSLYFIVQRAVPLCVGQVVTVLQKMD